MGGVDNGGGCAWGVGREYREISIPPTQFCCGLKTTLKKNNKISIYIFLKDFQDIYSGLI